MDLVEVAPQARPPVCRVMDYGKFRYDQSKKKDHSKQTIVKTITLRPKTDTHDLGTKLRQASKFLKEGNKVRFVMRMRGRERAHIKLWVDKLGEIITMMEAGTYTVSLTPRSEGRQIVAMIDPVAGGGGGGGHAPRPSGGPSAGGGDRPPREPREPRESREPREPREPREHDKGQAVD